MSCLAVAVSLRKVALACEITALLILHIYSISLTVPKCHQAEAVIAVTFLQHECCGQIEKHAVIQSVACWSVGVTKCFNISDN